MSTTFAKPFSVSPNTHSLAIGYLCWVFGFLGMHRFYYGKPITGTIWFFTFGLLGVGWLIDAFLIPGMDARADRRFVPGPLDYNIAWLLLVFLGYLGHPPLLHGQNHHGSHLALYRRPLRPRLAL